MSWLFLIEFYMFSNYCGISIVILVGVAHWLSSSWWFLSWWLYSLVLGFCGYVFVYPFVILVCKWLLGGTWCL